MKRLGGRVIFGVGRGLIRGLLLFYPRSFRQKFGTEIIALFARRPCGHPQPIGRWALLGLWARTVRGLLLTLLVEQITNLLGLVADAMQRFRELFGGEAASGREEENKRVARQSWLEGLRQDVWYGLRVLGRSPGFSAITMLILGLGIGANTSLFAVVNNIYFHPLPFRDSDRLVRVLGQYAGDDLFLSDRDIYTAIRQRSRTLEDVVAHRAESRTLTRPGAATRVSVAEVSPGWTEALGINLALGRPFTRAEEAFKSERAPALVSYSLWERRFSADPQVLGASLALEGQRYKVVGVMPRGFAFPCKADLWIPSTLEPPRSRHPKDAPLELSRYLAIVGRLKPGVTLSDAQADLDSVARTLQDSASGEKDGFGLLAVRLRETLLKADERDGMALVLLAVAGSFLLMACASVANLLLARSLSRRKEMVIRAALGASRRRQVRQLLVESLLLSLLGMLSGLVFVAWVGQYVSVLVPQALSDQFGVRQVVVDERVLGFSLGAAFLTCLLCGVVPALKSASIDCLPVLRAKGLSGTPRRPHRDLGALVMVQMALAMVLLAGAGHMIKHWWRSQATNPGLQTSNVLTMRLRLPESRLADWSEELRFLTQIREAVDGVPGVLRAGFASGNPLCCGFWLATIELPEQRNQSVDSRFNYRLISPGTVEALRMPVLAGRRFTSADDANSEPVALVSEAMARRLWPGESAIGKQLRLMWRGSPWRTVVGVVTTIPADGRDGETWYASMDQEPPGPWSEMGFHLMVRSAAPPRTVSRGVQDAIWNLEPNVAVNDVTTMDALYAASLSVDRKSTTILIFLAGFGLLLAAVGTYGVISYRVGERIREASLRVLLGAHLSDIWKMVLRCGLLLAVVGVGIGLVGGIVLVQLLAEVFPAAGNLDPTVLLLSAIVLLISASVACYIPARRAARLDPLVTLGSE